MRFTCKKKKEKNVILYLLCISIQSLSIFSIFARLFDGDGGGGKEKFLNIINVRLLVCSKKIYFIKFFKTANCNRVLLRI